MYSDNKEGQLSPKKDLFLRFSILGLILFVTLFLALAFIYYQKEVAAVTLTESRFLATEWRLLQELKEQTDQKLLDKDKEIADLNERYLQLARGNASSWDLQQIEIRLQQAKAEREEIFTQRIVAPAQDDQIRNAWLTELLPPGKHSALTKHLQNQNDTLETKLEESRLHIEMVEKKLSLLMVKQEASEQACSNTITENLTRISQLSAAIAGLTESVQTVLTDLQQKARENINLERPRIEDINTKALVRALISSPAIQAEYPDILQALDRFFGAYGLQERLQGRREAYATAAARLEPLARQSATP